MVFRLRPFLGQRGKQMILVDTALQERQSKGRPIRVGIVGAGFMTQGLVNRITHSTPGMRVVAVSNRKPERAVKVFRYAGLNNIVVAETQSKLDDAIRTNKSAATTDAMLLARSEFIDVVIEIIGAVEFGAHVILEAFKHGKDVVSPIISCISKCRTPSPVSSFSVIRCPASRRSSGRGLRCRQAGFEGRHGP